MNRDAAQALVDAFAALALLAAAGALLGRPRGAVRGRLVFAFGAAAAFYAARGVFKAFDSGAAERVSLVLASLLPLAALLTAEGLLRRHAPSALKWALAIGAALGLLAAGLSITPFGGASNLALMVYVLAGFAAVAALALLRRRSSLTAPENDAADALASVLAGVAALAATDFVSVLPVGLSGVGAAALAYAGAADVGAAEGRRRAARAGASALLVAAALTGGLAWAVGADWTGAGRLAAVCAAALLAVAVLIRLDAGRGAARGQGLRRVLAQADGSGLSRFLSNVAGAPGLRGLTLVEGEALAGYDAGALAAAFAAGPVATRADLAATTAVDAREQLGDLFERNAAAYAVRLTAEPLRLALLPGGPVEDPEAMRTDLLLFQRLAEEAANRGA